MRRRKAVWRVVFAFLLGAIVLGGTGCNDRTKMSKEDLEMVKERDIKEFEDAYPGRTFEIYDVMKSVDFYGYHYRFYYRCIEDDVEFQVGSETPLNVGRYAFEKLRKDGRDSIGQLGSEIFGKEVFGTWDVGPLPGYKFDRIYMVDHTIQEVLQYYYDKNYGINTRICFYIPTEEGEELDWKKEAELIYQLYEKTIKQYEDLETYNDYYYILVGYLKPGVGKEQMNYNGYYDDERLLKEVYFVKESEETRLPIKSSKDILRQLVGVRRSYHVDRFNK